MRVAGGEVPKVPLLYLVDEVPACSVEGCDSDFAFEDIGPFSFLVPMKLSDGTFVKTHVDAC